MRIVDYEVGEMIIPPSLKYMLVSDLKEHIRVQYFAEQPGCFTCTKDCSIEFRAKLIEDEES